MKLLFLLLAFSVFVVLYGCNQENKEDNIFIRNNYYELKEMNNKIESIRINKIIENSFTLIGFDTTEKVDYVNTAIDDTFRIVRLFENGRVRRQNVKIKYQDEGLDIKYFPSGRVKMVGRLKSGKPNGFFQLYQDEDLPGGMLVMYIDSTDNVLFQDTLEIKYYLKGKEIKNGYIPVHTDN